MRKLGVTGGYNPSSLKAEAGRSQIPGQSCQEKRRDKRQEGIKKEAVWGRKGGTEGSRGRVWEGGREGEGEGKRGWDHIVLHFIMAILNSEWRILKKRKKKQREENNLQRNRNRRTTRVEVVDAPDPAAKMNSLTKSCEFSLTSSKRERRREESCLQPWKENLLVFITDQHAVKLHSKHLRLYL